MLKAIAFGLACGAGIQAWRAWPPDGPVTADGAAVVLVLGVLCAYLGGRWHGRGTGKATAVAVASAEATATAVQSVNLIIGDTAARAAGIRVPTEEVSWFDGQRVIASADDFDGFDLTELRELEEHDR